MNGNKNKATFILGVVSVAFFISYPFRHSFMGGLLAGGFGAAMIGGLADWFAVTALFRRPLGIPWRTAIVPRNREKIFQAIVHMVKNQLLVKENIKSRLNEFDIAGILVKVMIEYGGKNVVKRMLYSVTREIVTQVKPGELGKIINDIIKDAAYKSQMPLQIIVGAEWLVKKGYDDKVIEFFLRQCLSLVKEQQVKALLTQGFIAVRKKYEHGMKRRKAFNQLLKLSEEEVGIIGQKALIAILTDMQDEKQPVRQKAKFWLQQWLIAKKTDLSFQHKIGTWIHQLFHDLNASQYAARYIAEFCEETIADNRRTAKWLELFTSRIDKWTIDFSQNNLERENFDAVVKNKISLWLDTYHDEIGKIVMESLDKFSNKMLVEFVESKVGNDLQMVRINGSVVGGLVGMVLYVATFWL